MADAGAIAINRPIATAMPLPVWAAGSREVLLVNRPTAGRMRLAVYAADTASLGLYPRNGRIAGTVQAAGQSLAGKWVILIYRDSFRVVATTRTNEAGGFEFDELWEGGKYLAVTLESLEPQPTQNAVVADYLTPVTP